MIHSILMYVLGVVVGAGVVAWRTTGRTAPPPAPKRCGHDCCDGRSDPRCAAGNCTYHCAISIGCNGRCLNEWTKAREAERQTRRPFFIDPTMLIRFSPIAIVR